MKKDFQKDSDRSSKTTFHDVDVPELPQVISGTSRDQLRLLAPQLFDPDFKATRAKPANRAERRLVDSQNRRRVFSAEERKARKRYRSDQKDKRRFERLRRKIQRFAPNARPTLIKDPTWIKAKELLAIPTATAAREILRNTRNKLAAATLRNAALGLQADGTYRYSWEDERARAVLALGYGIFNTAIPVRGSTGKTRYLCKGVPYAAWQALLSDPWTGEQPSKTAIGMTRHRPGGCLADGQIGYMRALAEAGFCYPQRIDPSEAAWHEKAGPSGYACLRIWVICPDPERAISDAEKARLFDLREAEKALQRADRMAENPLTVWGNPSGGEAEISPADASNGPEPRPPP